LFQLIPHFLPADNPQQSETASHIGVNGNRNCRRDWLGGSEREKESEANYEALYHPGVPRTADETVQSICSQVWLACAGNKTALDEIITKTGVKDKISQFWIQILLARSKEMQDKYIRNPETRDELLNDKQLKGQHRKDTVTRIINSIQQDLWDWVVKQPTDSYNQLSENDRKTTIIMWTCHMLTIVTKFQPLAMIYDQVTIIMPC
jgi:hypothetical protein